MNFKKEEDGEEDEDEDENEEEVSIYTYIWVPKCKKTSFHCTGRLPCAIAM